VGLEISLGVVKHKQSSIYKQKCFHCGKKGHRASLCTNKKKKGRSEKAGAENDKSVKKTRPKCGHCDHPGHTESKCWKKYPRKAPSKSSLEASGAFLDDELLVCNIVAKDKITCITQDVEAAYYCVPIKEDRQWEKLNSRMGEFKSLPNQEGSLKADPCEESHVMSNNKKVDNVNLNSWLELQELANRHDRQMKGSRDQPRGKPTKVCPNREQQGQVGSTGIGTQQTSEHDGR
jgi:hypothetical protein